MYYSSLFLYFLKLLSLVCSKLLCQVRSREKRRRSGITTPPQPGHRFRFTESWHKTDAGQPEYLDRTAAEDLRLGGQERKRMGHVPTDEDDGGRIRAGSRTGNRKDARTTGENRN